MPPADEMADACCAKLKYIYDSGKRRASRQLVMLMLRRRRRRRRQSTGFACTRVVRKQLRSAATHTRVNMRTQGQR